MRILLLVYGDLGRSLTGPEIRGLALARALATRHEVTVAIGDGTGDAGAGIRVVSSARRTVAREALRHDMVMAPSIPPYVLALKGVRPLVAVSDQYDPVELEVATLNGSEASTGLRAMKAARRLQLAYADVVLCANEAQRSPALHQLDGLARKRGPAARRRGSVRPAGAPEAEPSASAARTVPADRGVRPDRALVGEASGAGSMPAARSGPWRGWTARGW